MIEAEELGYQRDPLHVCDDYDNCETDLGSHSTVLPGCFAMDQPELLFFISSKNKWAISSSRTVPDNLSRACYNLQQLSICHSVLDIPHAAVNDI